MPLLPISFATLATIPIMACLLALYVALKGKPTRPWTEDMHTMLPPGDLMLLSSERREWNMPY